MALTNKIQTLGKYVQQNIQFSDGHHINRKYFLRVLSFSVSIPVAARSNAWVCVRSPAEIVGSNPAEGMDVCCACCVLSSRGLCDELITRPKESYRLWCVAVCDLETSRLRKPWPALGRRATRKKIIFIIVIAAERLNHAATRCSIYNKKK
jgi:hypothetical protein